MPPRLKTLPLKPFSDSCLFRNEELRHDFANGVRCFSSSTPRQIRTGPKQSKARRQMWRWLEGPGSNLKYPRQDSTNYLGAYNKSGNLIRRTLARANEDEQASKVKNDQAAALEGSDGESKPSETAPEAMPETLEDLRPFPLNQYFRSEAVLSEELRQEIYKRVVEGEQTVREVSIDLGVEMSRVGAVIRLMTVEQDWIRQGKPLARQYQTAVLKMLPKTPYNPNTPRISRHESINDLPVHPATLPQIFHPTSESRHFTREDAGRVFNPRLLPADARIPHPEMIESAKDRMAGMRLEEQRKVNAERIAQMERQRKEAQQRAKEQLAAATRIVEGRRWDFKFMEVSVDDVGKDGRGSTAAGWRYGFPHEDRKKGQVKIPTKVD